MLKIKIPESGKTRIRTDSTKKKWTDDNCLSILHYILDKQKLWQTIRGKIEERISPLKILNLIKKPTAEIFYLKMIERLHLEVKWSQAKGN